MDELERRLRAGASRPEDQAFTRRVLAALPPATARPRRGASIAGLQRSFLVATRLGLSLTLMIAAERWYHAGPGGLESLVVMLLVLVPALGAVSRTCGAILPGSVRRLARRAGFDWQ
jgi:hypothetical protein